MPLHTTDPLALRILMSEELYFFEERQAAAPVGPAPGAIIEETAVQPAFEYLGENKRFLLLVVNEQGHDFASAETIEALTRILAGLKMTMDDVALINISRYPGISFAALKAYFACSKAVLFGIDPLSVGLPAIDGNQVSEVDGLKLLATFAFTEMNANDQKKRLFWNELKKI